MGAGRQPLSPELAAALDGVREACFVPRPPALKNRLGFLEAQDNAQLLGRSLEALTEGDLWHYTSEGGNRLCPAELAYFLPRMFELIAEGRCPTPTGWLFALSALGTAGFPHDWPSGRVAAVQCFVAAFALDWLAEPERIADKGCWPDRIETLGDLLVMARNGNIALSPLLARLETSPQLPRALAVWSLRDAEWLDPHAPAETVAFHLATSAFSGRSKADMRDMLTEWLLRLDIPSRLAGALPGEEDPAWRDRLERALVLWP